MNEFEAFVNKMTGQPEPQPQQAFSEVDRSGSGLDKVNFAPEDLQKPFMPMLDPDNKPVEIPQRNIAKAIVQGYKYDPPQQRNERALVEKYGGDSLGNAAAAFGLGALRSASFGLSDVAGAAISPAAKEAIQQYAAKNPAATLGGEVAGVAATAFVPGSPVARVGSLAKQIVSGTGLAARAGAGAVEGAIYGAGQGISEAALGNTDNIAENLFANIGAGAVLGGGFSFGADMLGEGIGAAKGKLTKLVSGAADSENGQLKSTIMGNISDNVASDTPDMKKLAEAIKVLKLSETQKLEAMQSSRLKQWAVNEVLEKSPTSYGEAFRKEAGKTYTELGERVGGLIGK